MSTEKTEGLVIRMADFSESSRVVTFFTKDHGKISAAAKGAKRLKSAFESSLDLLSHCQIVYIRKYSDALDILTEAKLANRFRPQTRSLNTLYSGYYIAELLNGMTEEYDPHPALFDATLETLDVVAQTAEPALAVLKYELTLLDELGHLPEFDHCEKCGTELEAEAGYVYWVSQGGVLCHRCQKPQYQQNRIQPGTFMVLRRLTSGSVEATRHLFVTPHQQREIRHMMTASISQLLGYRPKMLRYLNF